MHNTQFQPGDLVNRIFAWRDDETPDERNFQQAVVVMTDERFVWLAGCAEPATYDRVSLIKKGFLIDVAKPERFDVCRDCGREYGANDVTEVCERGSAVCSVFDEVTTA